MAHVVLFHHAQGLTTGVRAFADTMRSAGHEVYTPDLFDGCIFATLEEGMGHIREHGLEKLVDRGVAVVSELPHNLVYAGVSWGVMPAQKLAQTRPGARGALLFSACLPVSGDWSFGPWPDGVPVQIHGMDEDVIFMGEGDVDAAREIVCLTDHAELFLYPGSQHCFMDNSLPSFDERATVLLTTRVLELLTRL